MKYICLGDFDENRIKAMSQTEQRTFSETKRKKKKRVKEGTYLSWRGDRS